MSKCKDCGHPWNIHEPIGFCTGNAPAYDQCGCDSIPDGTWFTVESLAAALEDRNLISQAWSVEEARIIIRDAKAAKEAECE